MTHGHGLAIQQVGARDAIFWSEMSNDLMAVEIEVNPIGRGAALRAAEHPAVKGTRLRQIANGKGEMKPGSRHRGGAYRRGFLAARSITHIVP